MTVARTSTSAVDIQATPTRLRITLPILAKAKPLRLQVHRERAD